MNSVAKSKYDHLFLNFFLVSSRHVLFAAHCVKLKKSVDTAQPEFPIFLFQNNLSEDLVGTEFEVAKIIVHPDWNILTQPYEADIAIAILKEPVEFSSNITNICLNSSSKPVDDLLNGTVCGWGHSETSGSKPVDELRAVTVPIVGQRLCSESRAFREIYAETLFCAGRTDIAAGPCKGDPFFSNFEETCLI
jgi:secreted trypsin-like serine protease